ncbi:uncharacterized protein LTR77_005140 [Saxophila tyrrhenica]|uniref:2EXR domain-containing protein n=1 Tax=Saxophila tyrrhenica TaxID=1690608 RepID=A0AAV9PE89_9PEZI|nr:hypothetical protein LTR77_005140 [Saxophila tyrrhenica]
MAPPPDQPCYLLKKLPAELRNEIWTLALASQTEHDDSSNDLWVTERPNAPISRRQPPITLTCRQIRDEALPFFYATGQFVASGYIEGVIHRLERWLIVIGDVHHLEQLTIATSLTEYHHDLPVLVEI